MDLQQRLSIINEQKRSYISGTVECINDQWTFFDNEDDEASMLEELIGTEGEVYTLHRWEKGIFVSDGLMKMVDYYYKLQNGDCIRFRKKLPFAYTELLESFEEDSFVRFTSTLNQLSFSLYDCIHCHNQMMYCNGPRRKGVNFITYDNTELLCNVIHHFVRGKTKSDRFEFTLSDGRRTILTSLK